MGWLSDLFKSGPVYKHWWRERNGACSFTIVVNIYGDGNSVETKEVAAVTFNSNIPLSAQISALQLIVKGLNNG